MFSWPPSIAATRGVVPSDDLAFSEAPAQEDAGLLIGGFSPLWSGNEDSECLQDVFDNLFRAKRRQVRS